MNIPFFKCLTFSCCAEFQYQKFLYWTTYISCFSVLLFLRLVIQHPSSSRFVVKCGFTFVMLGALVYLNLPLDSSNDGMSDMSTISLSCKMRPLNHWRLIGSWSFLYIVIDVLRMLVGWYRTLGQFDLICFTYWRFARGTGISVDVWSWNSRSEVDSAHSLHFSVLCLHRYVSVWSCSCSFVTLVWIERNEFCLGSIRCSIAYKSHES